ncbi:MAG: hypothetical protein ACRCSI_03790 [Eubacterium aggregans]
MFLDLRNTSISVGVISQSSAANFSSLQSHVKTVKTFINGKITMDGGREGGMRTDWMEIDKWASRWIIKYRWMDGKAERWMDGWMRTDRWASRWITRHGWMDGWRQIDK